MTDALKSPQTSRRDFLKASAAAATAAAVVPYFPWTQSAFANAAANDRPRIGCIGVGSMGTGDAQAHNNFGDILAVCDVDSRNADKRRTNGQSRGKGRFERRKRTRP